MSENLFQSQVNPTDYLLDYLDFGIDNGVVCIDALTQNWNELSVNVKNIRYAKMLAEYGRSIEELFVYIYALVNSDNFFDRLIYYNNHKLNSFIQDLQILKISSLLRFESPDDMSRLMNIDSESLAQRLCELPLTLKFFRNERHENIQVIYAKLKHPFLVYSKIPPEISDEVRFAILQKTDDKNQTDFNLTPIPYNDEIIETVVEYVHSIRNVLDLLIKCFIVSKDIRKR